ncbi:type II secretion system protein N [Marinobacter sp. SS21]|uniref:type II secretion system protein N n=1 Tax=Marinobacter sp. SS21 TaxID=2979460 RepID=UPI00232DA42C|nr:type II secretion system protein N [Marinobacter sp. SS21]MDC0663849.1 type II secretion system protein N [Marinobacter sp. SS21]
MAAQGYGRWERLGRLAANLLLVALVLYLAVTLARVTWMVLWQEQPALQMTTMASSGNTATRQLLNQPLAGYELFGRGEVNTRQVAESVRQSAPETRLRLRLEGVLVAERAEDSGAIVAGTDGITEHYRVGDTLPGNAELVEVEPGRILIRRNGLYETLTFEDSQPEELVTETEPVNLASPQAFVDDVQARLDAQGAAALVAFGLRPVQDGSASGYVYDGSNPMLRAVNLKAGDVITAINGQSLGDMEQDRALLESWRSQSQLDIEIERNGARFSVSYALPEEWRQ